MAKLCLTFVLVCVSLLLLTPSSNGLRHLHKGRVQSIVLKIQEELHTLALSIKNLKITSDADKAEINIMANELIHRTHQGVSLMNQAAIHIQNKEYRRKIGENLAAFEKSVGNLQRTMYEDDASKVQEDLASSLENNADHFGNILATVVKHHTDNETMLSDKLREASGIGFYALVKISTHTVLFTKTNKELGTELEPKLAIFENTADKIKSHNDEVTKNEVTQLIKFLTVIAEEVIVKLEQWMNLHTLDDDGFNTIKEASHSISELLNKLHHLVECGKPLAEVVEDFKQIRGLAVKQFKKLADIVLKGSPGDQEYIRDLLLANIAVSSSFSDDINLFLATKHINKFI